MTLQIYEFVSDILITQGPIQMPPLLWTLLLLHPHPQLHKNSPSLDFIMHSVYFLEYLHLIPFYSFVFICVLDCRLFVIDRGLCHFHLCILSVPSIMPTFRTK